MHAHIRVTIVESYDVPNITRQIDAALADLPAGEPIIDVRLTIHRRG